LKIELGYLEHDLTDWQESVDHPHCFEVCLDLVLTDGASHPSGFFLLRNLALRYLVFLFHLARRNCLRVESLS